MGLTLTLTEARNRTAYDLIQQAIQDSEPLIVALEDGTTVSIQQYQPTEVGNKEEPALKPLAKLEGFIPPGWKDYVYGEDGTGTP